MCLQRNVLIINPRTCRKLDAPSGFRKYFLQKAADRNKTLRILELVNFTRPLKLLSPCLVKSLSFDFICQVMFRRNREMRSVAFESVLLLFIVYVSAFYSYAN